MWLFLSGRKDSLWGRRMLMWPTKLTRNLLKSHGPSVSCIHVKCLTGRVRLWWTCLQVGQGTPLTNVFPDHHPSKDGLLGDTTSLISHAPVAQMHLLVCRDTLAWNGLSCPPSTLSTFAHTSTEKDHIAMHASAKWKLIECVLTYVWLQFLLSFKCQLKR